MEQRDAIRKVSKHLEGWRPNPVNAYEIQLEVGRILVYTEKEFNEKRILDYPRSCPIWVVSGGQAMIYSIYSTEYTVVCLR